MAKRFTNEEKAQARRLRAESTKLTEIARITARSLGGVWLHVTEVEKHAEVLEPWSPRADRLQADEREQIAIGLGQGASLTSIARDLGRAPSTVTREVVANGGARTTGPLAPTNGRGGVRRGPRARSLTMSPWLRR